MAYRRPSTYSYPPKFNKLEEVSDYAMRLYKELLENDSRGEEITARATDKDLKALIVRPEWYGAKGDGVHDDAAAINAAIVAGDTIVFSDKTYSTVGTITIPAHKRIILGNTIINYTGPTSAIKLTGSYISISGNRYATINHQPTTSGQDAIVIGDAGQSLGDYSFDGFILTGTANTRHMFSVPSQHKLATWRNLSILGPTGSFTSGSGIDFNGAIANGNGDFAKIEQVRFQYLNIGINQNNTNFTGSTISHCGFETIKNSGIDLRKGGTSSIISNNTFYNCSDGGSDVGVAGIRITPSVGGVGGAVGITIMNNSFQMGGGTATAADIWIDGGVPGLFLGYVRGIYLLNNIFADSDAGSAQKAIVVYNSYNIQVIGNIIDTLESKGGAVLIHWANLNIIYTGNICNPVAWEFDGDYPRASFDVPDTIRVTSSGNEGYYNYLNSNWAQEDSFELGIAGHKLITSGNYYWGTVLKLWTSDSNIISQERLRIDINGNVGINDPAPAEKLDVNGNINAAGVYKVADVQVIGAQALTQAALKADYTTGDLDTEAEIIAAINATNAGFNTLLAKIKTHGLLSST